mmetsp:Transcript_25475/g.44432  ORF Transcript_25475/g.44432 Transcript_25475/m.44432 type:complete len:279 (+) Transcript_25475:486-1322(+)
MQLVGFDRSCRSKHSTVSPSQTSFLGRGGQLGGRAGPGRAPLLPVPLLQPVRRLPHVVVVRAVVVLGPGLGHAGPRPVHLVCVQRVHPFGVLLGLVRPGVRVGPVQHLVRHHERDGPRGERHLPGHAPQVPRVPAAAAAAGGLVLLPFTPHRNALLVDLPLQQQNKVPVGNVHEQVPLRAPPMHELFKVMLKLGLLLCILQKPSSVFESINTILARTERKSQVWNAWCCTVVLLCWSNKNFSNWGSLSSCSWGAVFFSLPRGSTISGSYVTLLHFIKR